MSNIIVLIGCSGSGKSTWAHEQWVNDKSNLIIVSRDKIRELLFGYSESTIKDYYTEDIKDLEKQVTLYEDTLIYEALTQGKTVIVDATHLEKRYLMRYEMFNVPIRYKVFKQDIEELVRRDSGRVRSVGRNVIVKQFDRLEKLDIPQSFVPVKINFNKGKPDCYVFDIDGTLAEKGDRSPFDWSRVSEDTPIESIMDILEKLCFNDYDYSENDIFICSGRDEVCEGDSIKWIKNHIHHSLHFKYMFRPKGDMRPDWKIKQEMAIEISKTHNILGWFDDRLQVTRHLRQLGIKVLNVEHDNF